MQGVFEGFATIGSLIGLGILLAHVRFFDLSMQVALSRVAFFVASPALLFVVLSEADLAAVLTRSLVAFAGSVVIAGGTYLLLARLLWRRGISHTVVGTLCSSYVNAGNLGLAISAYVLEDITLIAPMLLLQLLIIQPVALSILDSVAIRTGFSVRRLIRRTLTNPLTLSSLLGVGVAALDLQLPRPVLDPLELIGGMAVPTMLLAYGISLRVGPRPGTGASTLEICSIAVIKIVLQPAAAYLIARFALGLDGPALFAVTIIAALPTAQNIFIHASRYNTGVIVTRDSLFITTVLSVPSLILVTALLS